MTVIVNDVCKARTLIGSWLPVRVKVVLREPLSMSNDSSCSTQSRNVG